MPTTRRSQRQALSCTECARRKTRCSKTIPCSSCVDRQISDRCRREPVEIIRKRSRKRRDSIPSDSRLTSSLAASSASDTGCSNEHSDARQAGVPQPQHALADGLDPRMLRRSPDSSDHPVCLGMMPDVPSTETTVTLEFLTHGRRNLLSLGGTASGSGVSNDFDSPNNSGSSTARHEHRGHGAPWDTVLSMNEARYLLGYHESRLAWMHNVVHMPTFREEFEASLEKSPRDGTWLALYYALVCTTFFHMEESEMAKFGIDTTARVDSARALYDKSLRCLYDANFMATHTITSVQTICILMQVAHNIDQSDFISVLIATGIRISQCLNMHRLGPDRPIRGSASMKAQSAAGRNLVDREVKKRVWWFLIRQDWLQIPFQNTYLIHPSQFNTPQPLNCHEQTEFMMADGAILPQPNHVYTQSTYTNILSKIAIVAWKQQDRMCEIGHPVNKSDGLQKLYDQVLWADGELKQIYANMPVLAQNTLRGNPSASDLPPYIGQIKSTKLLSVAHKTSTIHRHFIIRSFRDRRFSYTLLSCVAIAERCILDLEGWRNDPEAECMRHMWTFPTHLVSCCIILAMASIFRHENELFFDGERVYRLAMQGRDMLHELEVSSSIAKRGVILLDLLLKFDPVGQDPGDAHLNLGDIVRQVLFMETAGGQNPEDASEADDIVFPWGTHTWDVDFDMSQIGDLNVLGSNTPL